MIAGTLVSHARRYPPEEDRLSWLTETLRAAAAGREGHALALLGAAGVGKSWLAGRALAQMGCLTLTCSTALPLAQVVGGLPRPARLPAWAERTLTAASAGRGEASAALVEALAAALKLAAPVVFHLDDLHAASPEVRVLTPALAAAVTRLPGVVLLVTGRRPPGEPFVETWLEPLDEGAAGRLLEAHLGAPVPARVAAWIHERAGGNPLFTLEYLRQLRRTGHLWSDGRRWNWREPEPAPPPARVGAVLDHLVASATATVDGAAAVMAARALLPVGEVAPALWAAVAGVDERRLATTAYALTRHGVLNGGDFAHSLVRDAVRAGLNGARLRELARRALAELRHDPLACAPYVETAQLPRSETLALLLAAAAAAPTAQAAARLHAAASAHATGTERARLAYQAGLVLMDADVDAALGLLAAAAATPGMEHEVVVAYANALGSTGRTGALLALAADRRAQGAPERAVASLLLVGHHAAGAHGEALRVWREHPELNEAGEPRWLLAAAASALATGGTELAAELLERAVATPGVSAELHRDLLSLKALAAYHRADFGAAAKAIAEVVAQLRSAGAWRALSTALLNQAAFLKHLGDFAGMSDALEECLELRRAGQDGRSYAFAQAALAELRIDQARFDEADDLLAEALDTLELHGPSRFLANTLAMTSSLHLARGDFTTAAGFARRALAVARATDSPRVVREILFDAAVANARLGDAATARSQADEMAALAGAAGASPLDAWRTRWATGLALEAAGTRDEAAAELAAARAGAAAAGQELEANKAAIDESRVTGDERLAVAAVDWFDAHGLGVGRVLVARWFPLVFPAPVADEGEGVVEVDLEVLGPLRLGPTGSTLAVSGEWRRHLLAQLLLARLEGAGGRSDLELVDALYPGRPEPDARRALKQLVHQVRRKFGQGALVRTADGYALGDAVRSDAERFMALTEGASSHGASSHGAPSQRAAAALALWRGPAFQDVPAALNSPALSRLVTRATAVVAAVVATAPGAAASGADPAGAARLARWLQESAPYDWELVALEVRAHVAAGDAPAAAAALAKARERFAEVGAELPLGGVEPRAG